MKDLGEQLSANTAAWRDLDELKRGFRNSGGMNDARRYKVQQRTLDLAKEKRDIAIAMSRVDASFRPHDVAGTIEDMNAKVDDAQQALTRLRDHQAESYLH
jgi:hypothetical protein